MTFFTFALFVTCLVLLAGDCLPECCGALAYRGTGRLAGATVLTYRGTGRLGCYRASERG